MDWKVLGCASYAQGCAQTKWQGSKWKSSYAENHTNLRIVCYCNIVIHLNINTISIYHHQYRYHCYPHHHSRHHNHVHPVSTRQSPWATCLYQVHKWRDRFQPVWPANHWAIDPKQIGIPTTKLYTVVEHCHWVIQDEERTIAILQKKKQHSITWSQMWIYIYKSPDNYMLLDQLYLSLFVSTKYVQSA